MSEEQAIKFKEKIENGTKINFWISSCPKPLFEEFKDLANKEFADTYHLLLRYLLDEYKKSQEDNSMWEVIRSQKKLIDELSFKVSELESKAETIPKIRKTFGTGGKENE